MSEREGRVEGGEELWKKQRRNEEGLSLSFAPCLLPLSPSPHLEPARSFASFFARSLALAASRPPIGRPASARARSLAGLIWRLLHIEDAAA